MPKCGTLLKTAPAHLVVPAHNELQVAHKLPEGLVLREQRLCTRWNLFLMLEGQIFDFSQDGHQLKGQGRAGNLSEGDLHHGPATGFSQPGSFEVGGKWRLLAGSGVLALLNGTEPGQA